METIWQLDVTTLLRYLKYPLDERFCKGPQKPLYSLSRALIDESVPKTDDLYIRSVCFSPDGVYLATGAEDRVIRIWDIVNGRIKLKLVGHRQDIYSLDWTTYGRYIVSGSGDHTVKVYLL